MLIDRQGRIRVHEFGRVDDIALGMAIGQLMAEPAGYVLRTSTDATADADAGVSRDPPGATGCTESGCEAR